MSKFDSNGLQAIVYNDLRGAEDCKVKKIFIKQDGTITIKHSAVRTCSKHKEQFLPKNMYTVYHDVNSSDKLHFAMPIEDGHTGDIRVLLTIEAEEPTNVKKINSLYKWCGEMGMKQGTFNSMPNETYEKSRLSGQRSEREDEDENIGIAGNDEEPTAPMNEHEQTSYQCTQEDKDAFDRQQRKLVKEHRQRIIHQHDNAIYRKHEPKKNYKEGENLQLDIFLEMQRIHGEEELTEEDCGPTQGVNLDLADPIPDGLEDSGPSASQDQEMLNMGGRRRLGLSKPQFSLLSGGAMLLGSLLFSRVLRRFARKTSVIPMYN